MSTSSPLHSRLGWRAFIEANPEGEASFNNAIDYVSTLLMRSAVAGPVRFTNRFLFSQVVEHCRDVLLLSALDRCEGAICIIRPIFEKLITSHYISHNEGVVDAFLGYYDVNVKKLVAVAAVVDPGSYGDEAAAAFIAEITEKAKRFQGSAEKCPECKKRIPFPSSWTKVLPLDMARGAGMLDLYMQAYLTPHLYLHASYASDCATLITFDILRILRSLLLRSIDLAEELLVDEATMDNVGKVTRSELTRLRIEGTL